MFAFSHRLLDFPLGLPAYSAVSLRHLSRVINAHFKCCVNGFPACSLALLIVACRYARDRAAQAIGAAAALCFKRLSSGSLPFNYSRSKQ